MPVDPRAANRWLAVIIPVVEVLIFAYSAYTITAEVCINWLINPPSAASYPARPGAAIAVLIIYYILLSLALLSFARIIYTVYAKAGYIPLPPPVVKPPSAGNGDTPDLELGALNQSRPYDATEADPANFHSKDSFVCNPAGRPYWCDKCKNYKPDRAHHSSDVGRCVRGLDHFCPWAGGIIGEANHKFFNLFLLYTALLCVLVVVTAAVCVAEQKTDGLTGGHTYVCTVVVIPFAAFFGLITTTMFVVHFGYALGNTTTIEALQMKSNSWVAVFVGSASQYPNARSDVVTYPLPESGKLPERAFAIVKAEPGTNVYDRGALENWRLLMGRMPWDWLLPIRRSPMITMREKREINSDYVLGTKIVELKKRWANPDV